MKKTLFPIWIFLIVSCFCAADMLHADETSRGKLAQAKQYVAEGELDFAFMEYRALLQEKPNSEGALEATFAIGEYYFKQRNGREAKEAFEQYLAQAEEEIPRLLADVYLLQCFRLLGELSAFQTLEFQLKEMLSSKKLFLAFENERVQTWSSPLGNHFELREFVDRLEITQDGKSFYAIRLP
ncbi:MAG: hypothetical protein ABH845_03480 [Candidatus Omnitrophota bacterium]